MLSIDELGHLEEELKQFLIVNGIHGEEWAMICNEEKEKANELVGIFSDQILQMVYQKINFLEFRSQDTLVLFRFFDDHAESITVQLGPVSNLDLTNDLDLDKALKNELKSMQIYKASKRYPETREMEIHHLSMKGCVTSNETLWLMMSEVING